MGFFEKCKILFSIEVLLYHIRGGGVIFRSLWYTLSLHKVSNNYKKSPITLCNKFERQTSLWHKSKRNLYRVLKLSLLAVSTHWRLLIWQPEEKNWKNILISKKKVNLAKVDILLLSYFVSIVVAVPATSITTQDKIVFSSIFLKFCRSLVRLTLFPDTKCHLHLDL